MEFNQKLQALRKDKGLTQEELAEALFVSRAAVSKWESGRGYPSIDSLKDISVFFSVSIDDLLSGEKLLSLAEHDNQTKIRNICDLLFGISDLFSVLLVVLPLYPNSLNGYVYSVSLLNFTQASKYTTIVYWCMFVALFVLGGLKLILTKIKITKSDNIIFFISITVNIFAVLLLALTRQSYAVIVAFLILIIKAVIIKNR